MMRTVWWKSAWFWVLLAAAIYLVAGALVVPPLVKSELTSAIRTQTTLDPEVESVTFDPITFTLRLGNLSLHTSDTTVLDARTVTVNFDPFSSLYRGNLSFGNVTVDSPRVSVTRDQAGAINWVRYLVPPDTSVESAAVTDTQHYTVDRFRVTNGDVDWSDRSWSPNAGLRLSELDLNLENVQWPTRGKSPLQLRSKIGSEGSVRARGSVYPDTRTLDARFSLEDFALRDVNDHVRSWIRGRWESGRLDVRGTVRASAPPLTVNLDANSRLTDLQLVYLDGDTVGGWQKTTIDHIHVEWPKRAFRVGPIDVQTPHFVLKIDENFRTNLGQLLVAQTRDDTGSPQETDTAWRGSVGPIRVTSANLDFTDENVPGTFHAIIKELDGSIGAVSTVGNDTADVSLNGTLGDQSQVTLDGFISPFSFSSRSTITLEIANVGLPTLSPYSSKFLGYEIDRGKLLFTLEYRLEDGQLSGENHAVLEEFTLGEYVGNQMIRVPMRLVVALLKDSDGVIRVAVPVSGDVNDPSFSFSNAIYQAVQSILTSVVKSPFAYLAELVDADPDQLKAVEFEPGDSQLTRRAGEGLEKLVVIMEKRPLLTVGVRPGWTETDRRKLAAQTLDSDLIDQGGDPDDLSGSVSELETRLVELTSQEIVSSIRQEHTSAEGAVDEDAYARALYGRILETVEVDPERLRALAEKRASSIRRFLRERKVLAERIFVLEPGELHPGSRDPVVKLPLTVEGP